MSDSHKARHGLNCKRWKDTTKRSRCHARTRARLKKETKHSPNKTLQSSSPQKPTQTRFTQEDLLSFFDDTDGNIIPCPYCGLIKLTGKCCDRGG
jgi:hypothetical protein